MSHNKKSVTVALGTLAGGLVLAGSAFAMQPLAQGYMLASAAVAADKAPEGNCGAGKGKEGKCGMDKMDTDKDGRISRAEFAAAHDNSDSKFAAHDPDGDGFISADEMKAHHAAKAGAQHTGDKKAAGGKAAMEGKCGEGKCGSK